MQENIAIHNIKEFIHSTFGLNNIDVSSETPLALTFGHDYTLMFHFGHDTTKLSILKHISEYSLSSSITKLLEQCHIDSPQPFTLQAGYLNDNILSLSAHMTTQKLTLPNLSQYFEVLFTVLNTAISEGAAA